MNRQKDEKGLLSLEACIVVTLFIFLMLWLYSFFIVFEARNEIAHVVLSTCNSLALDTYENNKQENTTSLFSYLYYSASNDFWGTDSNPFANTSDWNRVLKNSEGVADGIWNGTIYASEEGRTAADKAAEEAAQKNETANTTTRDVNNELAGAVNTVLGDAVQERFFAYLAGGDSGRVEQLLKRLHVVGGVSGFDFSGTYISGKDLHVVVRYSLEYEFNTFSLGEVEFEQSAVSRLWS